MTEKIDYEKLGLKCGLEIHQMLDTKHKLFCACPTELRKDKPHFNFKRKLRPTRSELGEMDPAALFEFKKGRVFLYEAYQDSVCLVEMDEEPPHDLNREALEIALEIALLLNAKPVDEVHVMRKIVIDGSNTTGFQRTALIAIDGYIDVDGKRVPIQTICLEEDAARKIGEEREKGVVIYRLDRLGIPLIEIATGPVMHTPEEAQEVARRIGRLLRVTGKVKRGLGTIRQDLNVSIAGGARVEIKGVQRLEHIAKIIELEVKRQLNLLRIRDELKKRGVKREDLNVEPVDVTHVFEKTKSKIVRKALSKGGVALAIKLKGFAGLIGREIQPGRRLGTEFADHARFWGGVGGIFHSDELPSYGISAEEVERIKEVLKCRLSDAFVLVFGPEKNCRDALKAVIRRAKEALIGVPEETRGANPDCTTRYLRPMPGKARMYPETDIRPARVSEDMLARIRESLPEFPEVKLRRFVEEFGLSRDLAEKILDSHYLPLFEEVVSKGVSPTLAATTLTNTLIELRREGIEIEALSEEHLRDVLLKVTSGEISKEAISQVLTYLSRNPDRNVEDAVKALGLTVMSPEEVREYVRKVISEHRRRVEKLGGRAMGFLMGMVMKELRGRADGKLVSEIVREELRRALSTSSSS